MDLLISSVAAVWTDFSLRLMPVYIGATVLIALAIYVFRVGWRGPRDFVRWVVPAELYFHPSHIVDIKLFLFGRLLAVAGVLNLVVLQTMATVMSMNLLGGATGLNVHEGTWSWGQMALATLLFAVVADFCTYWVHRIHHEYPVLWPFHSVHHSAEVLTPVTVYRKHPFYDLISQAVKQVLIGAVAGAMLLLFTSKVDLLSIGGANAIFVVFNLIGSNFRHSHIWISYGPLLEHVFISPAQHQIHHSRAVVHHDRNYGEIFAIWDWMFGTLYIPREREELQFGLADRDGTPIEQAHTSLGAALLVPLRDSGRAVRERFRPGSRGLAAGEQ